MTVHRHSVALIPRDGFFCKDGRGWHAGMSERGYSVDWPWPSTILGAMRSAWGRMEETKSDRIFGQRDWVDQTKNIVLGSTVALRRPFGEPWSARHRLWPTPADAVSFLNRVIRLNPTHQVVRTLGRDDDPARELLWFASGETVNGKPLRQPRWWSDERFTTWLAGQALPSTSDGTFDMIRRLQVQVSVGADEGVAREGGLFSHDVIETIDREGEWAIGAEVCFPTRELPAYATLGSDRKLATIEPVSDGLFDEQPSFIGQATEIVGLRIVVVTPASFTFGWLPDGFERRGDTFRGQLPGCDAELILRAAMIGRPVSISGWDMASGHPKPTARMVPPGSVYFFERADGQSFSGVEMAAFWMMCLGARSGEGFGRVVPGVWDPKADAHVSGSTT